MIVAYWELMNMQGRPCKPLPITAVMLNGYDDSHTIFFMRKLEDTIND